MALARRKFLRNDDEAMSPHTSAYCQARARLPLKVLNDIHEHLAERLHNHIPLDGLWHKRHVRMVDGTSLSMPDTETNQARWPQSKSQKTGCGFPVMNLVGIFCLHSGALMQAAYGERKTHETRLFRQLWDTFEPGDLALADRGFCSYAAIAGLLSKGVDSLMRLPEKKIRVAIGSKLPKEPDFDVTVTWSRPTQRPPGVSREDFALLPESKGSLDTLRQFANAASGAENKPRTVAALVDEMLLAIARDLVPLRPDRIEPRVRKRRPKNYRLMTKPRKEIGPLPHRKIGRENHSKTSLS